MNGTTTLNALLDPPSSQPIPIALSLPKDKVEKLAKRRVKTGNAAIPINTDPNARGVAIFAKQNSPVIQTD